MRRRAGIRMTVDVTEISKKNQILIRSAKLKSISPSLSRIRRRLTDHPRYSFTIYPARNLVFNILLQTRIEMLICRRSIRPEVCPCPAERKIIDLHGSRGEGTRVEPVKRQQVQSEPLRLRKSEIPEGQRTWVRNLIQPHSKASFTIPIQRSSPVSTRQDQKRRQKDIDYNFKYFKISLIA